MISCAVLGPTPGSCCNCAAVAAFKSSGLAGGRLEAAKQLPMAKRTNAGATNLWRKGCSNIRFIDRFIGRAIGMIGRLIGAA